MTALINQPGRCIGKTHNFLVSGQQSAEPAFWDCYPVVCNLCHTGSDCRLPFIVFKNCFLSKNDPERLSDFFCKIVLA